MEERTSPWDSRKWPSAARPGKRWAYFAVPAEVAEVVIASSFLLFRDRKCWGRVAVAFGSFLLFLFRFLLEEEDANRRAGFCDRASLFRGKRFRPRGDYCNTSEPVATNVRRVRCGRRRELAWRLLELNL